MSIHDPLAAVSSRVTPQSQPIPGSTQVPNSAGGHSFEVDIWTRLHRFLVLGTDGGSYYASERDLTTQNVQVVRDCLAADGPRTVAEVVTISKAGRAPKNKHAIFALALAASDASVITRTAALAALPDVCRTGTHLFQFIAYVENHRGWGRGLKRGVAQWFTEKDADALAYQLVKYKSRDGWSMRDVLRLAKPTPRRGTPTDLALRWAVGKLDVNEFALSDESAPVPDVIERHAAALRAETPEHTAALVSDAGGKLSWEMVRSDHLRSPEVWKAFIPNMGVTALIRNIARFSNLNMFEDPVTITAVTNRLVDAEQLRRARVHPLQVLIAQSTYAQGHGEKGKMTWIPNGRVIDALNEAFHKSFAAVEPSNVRTLLALDFSASMDHSISSAPLSARAASAAMALVTVKTEPVAHVIAFDASPGGFTYGDDVMRNYAYASYRNTAYWGNYALGVKPVNISGHSRVDDVVRALGQWPGGRTDCALPIVYALSQGLSVDHFVIYTDSESWAGPIHVTQALKMYRERTGIDARLTVVAMVANQFSVADPNDAGMLDVVGFDTAAPALIADFGGKRI